MSHWKKCSAAHCPAQLQRAALLQRQLVHMVEKATALSLCPWAEQSREMNRTAYRSIPMTLKPASRNTVAVALPMPPRAPVRSAVGRRSERARFAAGEGPSSSSTGAGAAFFSAADMLGFGFGTNNVKREAAASRQSKRCRL
eukprot:SAG11_NODE_10771_length_806_cov_1.564356_2_plen_142_part_00